MTDTTPPANLTPAELAEWQSACAATPGPYQAASWERIIRCDIEGDINPASIAFRFSDGGQQQVVADARNIATNADPTTVRARLREISELRAEVGLHELRMAELSHVLHWREQQLDIIAELVAWLGVDCYKTSNLEEFRNAITAALRTDAGTDRLDTEGESDGVDQGE